MKRIGMICAVAMMGLASPALAGDYHHGGVGDFGLLRENLLNDYARELFGFRKAVPASSIASISAGQADADPTALVTVAKGLRVKVVSARPGLGANIDMMALWPDDKHPTHIIACNEQGTDQPGVQRISLADGSIETILTGTRSCDPAHRTPWGTIVIGEERDDGTILEIIDPLHTTGVTYGRVAHTLSGGDAGNVAVRTAIGHLAFEGVAIYPNGVMYYGDENRPSEGTPGGAYFKFIPETPWPGGAPISKLEESPLVAGQVYGLRLGKRNGDTDYGQGTETGLGTWIEIENADDAMLREIAGKLPLTGYYRPEDAAVDLKSLKYGNVRLCANNTGNEENDMSWGNTICLTDGTLAEATANTATPEVQLFVVGTSRFAMMDNIAYQPGRGNWVMQEDGDAPGFDVDPHNNDIWMCLEDGADDDDQSDGCLRFVTLNDLNAESSGGLFDGYGRNYYVSVQHNVTGHGVILKISGWGDGHHKGRHGYHH